jgi:hypothetical protein
MSDEEAATIPAQAAPIADPTIDTTGAAAIAPFREAFETARQAFEAARPPSSTAPAASAHSNAFAGDQLTPPDPMIPLIPNHSDVNMDDVVLHEEPEQIDAHLPQPTEVPNNNAPGIEPSLPIPNEQDQQEENDSLQVDTAIQAATDAAASSTLTQPTEAIGSLSDEGEEDDPDDW